MPPKTGGGGGSKKRYQSVDNQPRQSVTSNGVGHVVKNPLASQYSLSKFTIAPLIVEGVKLNKLELNDIIKQHMKDIKLSNIQLSRSGMFTLYATDVKSFNRILNDFASILATNGQAGAKVYVPRSIQRIKDTEKVAFVKRVDLEIPENRIIEALKDVGLDATDVIRLTNKDRNMPTTTIKITFNDPQNRNTFLHTGLQVDSMHFTAEPASQNVKPVQCFLCLKYNHVAKYCKIKQQICSRCGENHRFDQCTAASDLLKCSNCMGKHLATSNECPQYKEQEKRMLNLVNQYSATSKATTTIPALNNVNEFPSLPNIFQQQHDHIQNEMLDRIVNALTSKMEKIIEETTNRLFKSIEQKMRKLEKSMLKKEITLNDDSDESDSDSSEESQVIKHINNKQTKNVNHSIAKQSNINTQNTSSDISNTTTATSNDIAAKTTTAASNDTTAKPQRQQKGITKQTKRYRSPNSSLDSSTLENKDLKSSNNDDKVMSH